MPPFPSIKARRLMAILTREPLPYRIVRQRDSHRTLTAPGRPRYVFAFHDRDEIPGGLVRVSRAARARGVSHLEEIDLARNARAEGVHVLIERGKIDVRRSLDLATARVSTRYRNA